MFIFADAVRLDPKKLEKFFSHFSPTPKEGTLKLKGFYSNEDVLRTALSFDSSFFRNFYSLPCLPSPYTLCTLTSQI